MASEEDGDQGGGRPMKKSRRNSAHAPTAAEASGGACDAHAPIPVVGEEGVRRK